MRNILVTGGTVFVSRYVARWFVQKGDNVFVLNRNHNPQESGVTLIEADRHNLGDKLKEYDFDAVLDITAYTREDVRCLAQSLPDIRQYIFVSSSAVYPETLERPFREDMKCGYNTVWGDYGKNKLEAEQYIIDNVQNYYILRPPYLYGPMQNLYREPFMFDCAIKNQPCYIPKDGSMPLQFFHVEDLCRFIEVLLEKRPEQRIFNVGNPDTVDVKEWARLCYEVAGAEFKPVFVDESHTQRSYFCFYDYAYALDVTKQCELMPDVKPLSEGLRESYQSYVNHSNDVNKKPYFEYIEKNLRD